MNLSSIIKNVEGLTTLNDDDIKCYSRDGKDICEVSNVPNSRQTRAILNERIRQKIEEEYSDLFATLVTSVKVGNKNYSSKARVVKISDAQKGGNIVGVVKLTPKPKLVLTPKLFGVTRNSGPTDSSSYLTIDQMVSTIKSKLDELVEEEKITIILSDWTKAVLDYYNPSNSSGSVNRITSSWRNGLEDEVSSEMLELFCAIAYIKYIRGQSDPTTSVLGQEKLRVKEIIGKNIPRSSTSFKIWYPGASNYPIIDCQVAYFEGNVIKAVFPISTKNVTGGREPNVIKFVDIFKNAKQVDSWKIHLPREVIMEQQFQYKVSRAAITNKGTLYPAAAAETLLKTPQTKSKFLGEIRKYSLSAEVSVNENQAKAIANKISSNSRNRKGKLDNISLGNNLILAKKLVCVLLKKTIGTGSPYKEILASNSSFSIERLSKMNETQWNDSVKSRYRKANYPYTVENLSLFFEKVLENSSVYKNGDVNYDQIIERAYFKGNKVLQSKYGGQIISGAGDIILAKVDINTTNGLIDIRFDTSKNLRTDRKYGLRSKNSLNNLQDALGITP